MASIAQLLPRSRQNRSTSAPEWDQASISVVKGEIALANGRVAEAIEHFELSTDLESRYPSEPMAMAYRKLGNLKEAAGKYQEIIVQCRISGKGMEDWILAHYELAKIYKELGDTQKSKEYFGKLLNIWKDADPDIPILKKAKAEYAGLQ